MPSGPLTILHTADLHFGRRFLTISRDGDNVRELDVYKAGETVSHWIANELKPDLAIIAGDIWDDSRPTPRAAQAGYDFVSPLREADIDTVVCGGNHDTVVTLGRPSALQHLERYFGCHVALHQTEFDLQGLRICAIPFRSLSTGEMREPDYSSETPNVLICHADADGDDLPDFAQYGFARLPRPDLFDDRSCLRLLGHVHIHQSIGPNAYYCGAIERLNWKEIVNTPAVYVHEVWPDGKVETRSVTVAEMGADPLIPRPALVLDLDCAEIETGNLIDAAIAHLDAQQMEDHLVHLTLSNAPNDLYSINYEDALRSRARQRKAFELEIKPQLREEEAPPEVDEAILTSGRVPGAALSEQYRAFAAQSGEQDLADLGCELIAKACGEAG